MDRNQSSLRGGGGTGLEKYAGKPTKSTRYHPRLLRDVQASYMLNKVGAEDERVPKTHEVRDGGMMIVGWTGRAFSKPKRRLDKNESHFMRYILFCLGRVVRAVLVGAGKFDRLALSKPLALTPPTPRLGFRASP